ncbi:MAG: CDP-diacylglycerol--glycerol-3-phosphate 3-phosphatidyltransferase [Endomicrobium sp.]|jgi:CDP-diacylglycerol--glycerol-3-phosphate 3-phosphatidyltransferase|nr:CDP-diacylglycerol--glycerol-3-phosphate 3-phosphatidyltransferase [Endomicrobium sp.]
MNLPNKLTLARICLVPFFIFCVEFGGFWSYISALIIFCIASITDFFDGLLARKYNEITSLGIFIDPLADKLLISAAFICFVDVKIIDIPAWMVVIIISREFLITGLRSIAASKNIVIPADKYGKFKTSSQITVIIIILLVLILNEASIKTFNVPYYEFLKHNGSPYYVLAVIMQKIPYWATLIATILTMFSGWNYMRKHIGVLK